MRVALFSGVRFPKRTLVLGDTTKRSKEEVGSRRADDVSGPNPDADFVCGLFFSSGLLVAK